jgi:predicted transcriptional regulator
MASTGTRVITSHVVALEDRRSRLTMEALAEVDAGRTVDHAEVEAWIDSLDTAAPLPAPVCGNYELRYHLG